MKCPNCNSNQTVKNGQRKGRQCYKCKQQPFQGDEERWLRSLAVER